MPFFSYPFNNSFRHYNYPYNNKFNNSNSYKDFNNKKPNINTPREDFITQNKNNSNERNESSSYFFELFGLKLYFDDILLICLLFFLYQEGVKDDELFISLILLLLT